MHRKLKRLTDQSVGFHYTGFSAEKPLDEHGVICEIFKTIKPALCKTENFCPILHWAGKGTQPAAEPFFTPAQREAAAGGEREAPEMRSPGLFCSVFFGVFMGLTVISAILKTKNRTVKPFWLHGAFFTGRASGTRTRDQRLIRPLL